MKNKNCVELPFIVIQVSKSHFLKQHSKRVYGGNLESEFCSSKRDRKNNLISDHSFKFLMVTGRIFKLRKEELTKSFFKYLLFVNLKNFLKCASEEEIN